MALPESEGSVLANSKKAYRRWRTGAELGREPAVLLSAIIRLAGPARIPDVTLGISLSLPTMSHLSPNHVAVNLLSSS